MAPMGIGGLVEPDGRLSQQGIDYFVARAKGGTGLIITCVARASREIEQLPNMPFVRQLMVDNNIYVARLSQLADGVHDYGAKVAVQLTAGFGRVAGTEYLNAGVAVSASSQPCFWDPRVLARELTTEEVGRLVQSFEFGAEIVRTAGIDAVELHGHEGYLFDQFTTALWNKRSDRYGGDLNGRLRFSLEIIEAIKRGAGVDFPIIYRFGLTHYLPGGREVDEGLEVARRLEAAGVDALHIDAGCYETWYWAHPPTYQPPGCMVELAEMVKKVVSIPVITVGRLGYPELAEAVLQEGRADFVALGRPLLADPEWPNKVKEGRSEDICHCLGDHDCLKRVLQRKYIGCTVNPAAGMEREFVIKGARDKKSVLIVGAGPAGLEAARVAALRGHDVVVWERSDSAGGNVIPASVPDFKKDYRLLLDYFSMQMKKLGVAVELGKEATAGIIQKMRPDIVCVATGARPIIPEIPGVEQAKVVTAIDVLLGKREVGEAVAMIGGGQIGCKTALYLAQRGKMVTVIELLETVARDLYSANRMHLLKLLDEAGVTILTERKTLEVAEEGITVIDTHGKKTMLAADSVVLAVGLQPNRELLAEIRTRMSRVYAIGDCVEPRKVLNAVWEGFRTARLI
jgi:2-enoate reductase